MKTTLSVEIEMENAAFGDTDSEKALEAARILRELATKLEEDYNSLEGGYLRDYNGNTVGEWSVMD